MDLKTKFLTAVFLSFWSASFALPRLAEPTSKPWDTRQHAWEAETVPETAAQNDNQTITPNVTTTSSSPSWLPSTSTSSPGGHSSPSGRKSSGIEAQRHYPDVSSLEIKQVEVSINLPLYASTPPVNQVHMSTGDLKTRDNKINGRTLVTEASNTVETSTAFIDSSLASNSSHSVERPQITSVRPFTEPTELFFWGPPSSVRTLSTSELLFNDTERLASLLSTPSFLSYTTRPSVELIDHNNKLESNKETTLGGNIDTSTISSNKEVHHSVTGRESEERPIKTNNNTSSAPSSDVSSNIIETVGENVGNFDFGNSRHGTERKTTTSDQTRTTAAHGDQQPSSGSFQPSTSSSTEQDFENLKLVTSSVPSTAPESTIRTTQRPLFQPHANEGHKRRVRNYSDFVEEIESGHFEDEDHRTGITEAYDFRPTEAWTELSSHRNGNHVRDETPIVTNQSDKRASRVSHFSMKEDSMISEQNDNVVDILKEDHELEESPNSRRIDSSGHEKNSLPGHSNVETPFKHTDSNTHKYIFEHSTVPSFPRNDLPQVSLPPIVSKHDDVNDVLFQFHPHISDDPKPLFDEDEHTNFSYSLRDLDKSNAQETPDPSKFDLSYSTEVPIKFSDSIHNISTNSDTFETPLGPMTRQDTKTMLYLLVFVCSLLLIGLLILLIFWGLAKREVRRLDMEMRRACLQGLDHRYAGRVE